MIGRIKRAITKSVEDDPHWDLDSAFGGDEHHDTESWNDTELPDIDKGDGVFAPDTLTEVERQANLIRVAMQHGGKFGTHEIPLPWLRMTLAGLEGRAIDVDEMWEGIASPYPGDLASDSEPRSYRILFPS